MLTASTLPKLGARRLLSRPTSNEGAGIARSMGAGLSKDGTRKNPAKTVSSAVRLLQFSSPDYKFEQVLNSNVEPLNPLNP